MATIIGTANSDMLTGTDVENTLTGLAGNDTLIDFDGSYFDGNTTSGIVDTAVYQGIAADYEVRFKVDGSINVQDTNIVNGNEGVDGLTKIETLQFADRSWRINNNFEVLNPLQTKFDIAAMTCGSVMLIKTSLDPNHVYAQRFSYNGAVGESFRIDKPILNNSSTYYELEVLGLANDSFVAVWADNNVIKGRCYDANNAPIGQEFAINGLYSDVSAAPKPQITALPDGGFIVGWLSQNPSVIDAENYYGQRFDRQGVMIGTRFSLSVEQPYRINYDSPSIHPYPALTTLANGDLVTVLPMRGLTVVQRIDVNGHLIGEQIPVIGGSDNLIQANITALNGGGFVTTWGLSDGVYARIYNDNGVPTTDRPFLVSSNVRYVSNTQTSQIVSLADGGFVIAWMGVEHSPEVLERFAVMGQRYNHQGIALGAAFPILDSDAGDLDASFANQNSFLITALADGGLFVVSRDMGQTVTGVYIDANGNRSHIEGSNLDDVMRFAGSQSSVNIAGLEGNDVISTGSGDDVLDGGLGADTLKGGFGSDIYHIDNVGDVVIEAANAGVDTVKSTISYTLGVNVENLTLQGTTAINGIGNILNNHLIGNNAANRLIGAEGNDTLNGGEGQDTLIGGLGNDNYTVDNAGDVVTEWAGNGTDQVFSNISYALTANVENLTLTQYQNINGIGNSLNNKLTGNNADNMLNGGLGNDYLYGAKGADTLNGGLGADTMLGGLGNDHYFVDNTGDVVSEALGAGIDDVTSTISYTLKAHVENLTLVGANAMNGIGNNLNNTLKGSLADNSLNGGLGDDTLYGYSGADTLNGGKGTDTLLGGLGNDSYMFGRGLGVDTIIENDNTTGNTDTLQLLTNITTKQLWFSHQANNLEISIIGTTDKVIIQDWYLGKSQHIETIKTSDGHTLTDANVEKLVAAMAAITPPALGQTTLTSAQHQQLDGVIAANWS